MSKDKGRLASLNNESDASIMGLDLGELDQEAVSDSKYRQLLQKLRGELQKFTREWNAD